MNERYSRQILFREIGAEGQEKLAQARVLIVGCGALGAAHAETLARAGVGFLRLVDRDFVEVTNLQRQTLYSEADAAERLPKAVAARNRIVAVNSGIEVEPIVADVTNSNIESLIKDVDLVIDGTDNFQVRYLVNDACVKHGTPWIYGAAVSSYGTTMTVWPGRTPCLKCVFDEMPDAGSSPTCDTAGVIQPIISSISAIQTTEALKLLTGQVESLHGCLIQVDVWNSEWRKVRLGERDPECACCAKRQFVHLDASNIDRSTVMCGRDAVQVSPPRPTNIDLPALAATLGRQFEVKQNEYLVRFTADGTEVTVFADGRAIFRGVDDPTAAKSLYARYVGA
jgi:adenylyltransferase/sulfurtransferase